MKRNFLVCGGARSAETDAAPLVPTARDFTGEIEHQAVLNGDNHAHIAPGRGIRAECGVQSAVCLSALDKLANKAVDGAIVLADTLRDLGIGRFNHCLKENALDLRIGFDRSSIVLDDPVECIQHILLGPVGDAFVQDLKKLRAKFLEYRQEETLLAPEMFIEHRLGYLALAGQVAHARLRIGGTREDPFGALQDQRAPLFTAQPYAFFWLRVLLSQHSGSFLFRS